MAQIIFMRRKKLGLLAASAIIVGLMLKRFGELSATFEPAMLTFQELACQFRCKHNRWLKDEAELMQLAIPAEVSLITSVKQREGMKIQIVASSQDSCMFRAMGSSYGFGWKKERTVTTASCECSASATKSTTTHAKSQS